MTREIELQIAQLLLDIHAVTLSPKNPFVWTSGLRTPIYCDNRLIMSYPKERMIVEEALANLIQTQFGDVDVVAGVATAGIPHASMVAQILQKPMIYVRSDAKKHGKKNAIEGFLPENSKVVMIEDLISTGKSVIQAAQLVEDSGSTVVGCAAIFNYLLPVGKEAFEKAGYPLATLTNYESLLEQALKVEELKPYKEMLANWHKNPQEWSAQH